MIVTETVLFFGGGNLPTTQVCRDAASTSHVLHLHSLDCSTHKFHIDTEIVINWGIANDSRGSKKASDDVVSSQWWGIREAVPNLFGQLKFWHHVMSSAVILKGCICVFLRRLSYIASHKTTTTKPFGIDGHKTAAKQLLIMGSAGHWLILTGEEAIQLVNTAYF